MIEYRRKMGLGLVLFSLTLGLSLLMTEAEAQKRYGKEYSKGENMLIMELKTGKVVIEMFPRIAPRHVERVRKLVREGFYDGIIFHRVIEGFMAQTGDPTGTGMGGSPYPDVPAEFTREESFTRGTVGAARSSNPNSANSQFFICFADASFLDGQYTIWGRVVEGMEHVDQITRGEPPANPDKIIKMRLGEE